MDKLSCLSSLAAMKSFTSMDSSDNKKTRHKLKKFLTRRPTLQAVRDKGYIKGIIKGFSWCPSCGIASLPPALVVLRSGVRLQPLQPVSKGEHHGAHVCQDVHRPRGERQWVLVTMCRLLILLQGFAPRNHSPPVLPPLQVCVLTGCTE